MDRNPARDRRHSIAHLIYVVDPDRARFKRLGVGVQFSASWFSADPDTVVNLAASYGAPRAAYQIRMEDKVGSVEVGKLADLIVLDRNIMEGDPHDIHGQPW